MLFVEIEKKNLNLLKTSIGWKKEKSQIMPIERKK